MPKIIIPSNELPPIIAEQDAYFVRYRIITDDQNVSSYWSSIYSINPEFYYVPGSIYSRGTVKFSELKDSGPGNPTHAISISWDTASIRKSVQDSAIANSYIKLNISSATYSAANGGKITYNVGAHNLVAGQIVSVYGCDNAAFNFEEGTIDSVGTNTFVFDPIYTPSPTTSAASGTLIGKSVLVGELDQYDIWIKWAQNGPSNDSAWSYKERVSGSSTTINIPDSYLTSTGTIITSTPDILYIEIYRPGTPITRDNNTDFLLYSASYSF